MLPHLVAICTLTGSSLTAAVLFRRFVHHSAAALAGGMVCLRCAAPATWLTSFTCPACGHDVRERGLGPRRRRTQLGAFWSVVVFTFAYVLAAAVAGNLLFAALPVVHHVSRNSSLVVSSPNIRGVEMFLDAAGPGEDDLTGLLTADLYGAAGVVTLEVDVPSHRWRLRDANGKQLDAGDALDGKVIYRWMQLGGAAGDSDVAHSDAGHIASNLGNLLGTSLSMPPVPRTGRPLALSYSASSGGGSWVAPDPRWEPLLVTAAALLWLSGVYLILLAHRAKIIAPSSAGSPVAPQGATA